MSQHTKNDLSEKQENIYQNLAVQFKRDFNNCNNGSFETRSRYWHAVGERFGKYLAVCYRMKKIENVCGKHIRSYVEYLQAHGKSAGYIYTELSAIRFWHKHSRNKNRLPDNKSLTLEKRQIGRLNRGFLDCEIKDILAKALEQKNFRLAVGVKIVECFGLRKNELVTLRVYQLENALKTRQLHIPNGKGGQARDIPLDTKEQFEIVTKILDYAKRQGKKSANYLFCNNHKDSVLKTKRSFTDWMSNHVDEILSPDRKTQIADGKKERADSGYGWHALRHTYAQRSKARLLARGMSEQQARREVSERLGHHRSAITKIYEE